MCCMPDVRARDRGVFPVESMRLKFTGIDFNSFESEIKQECVNPSKHPNSLSPDHQGSHQNRQLPSHQL
jgi:hypothetical protein